MSISVDSYIENKKAVKKVYKSTKNKKDDCCEHFI